MFLLDGIVWTFDNVTRPFSLESKSQFNNFINKMPKTSFQIPVDAIMSCFVQNLQRYSLCNGNTTVKSSKSALIFPSYRSPDPVTWPPSCSSFSISSTEFIYKSGFSPAFLGFDVVCSVANAPVLNRCQKCNP